MSSSIHCFPADRWAAEGATLVAAMLKDALDQRPLVTLMLAGGSTPRPLYKALATHDDVDWKRVHFFWGDERMVPPIDDESNFRMAWETLLQPVGIGPNDPRVHPIPTDDEPAINAARYAIELRRFFDLTPRETPQLDIVLLGMGRDGHTASLFPRTPALQERQRLVVANLVPGQRQPRVTVTFPLLNHARALVMLVTGSSKAAKLRSVLELAEEDPVQQLDPADGEQFWVLDEAAVSELPDVSACHPR